MSKIILFFNLIFCTITSSGKNNTDIFLQTVFGSEQVNADSKMVFAEAEKQFKLTRPISIFYSQWP